MKIGSYCPILLYKTVEGSTNLNLITNTYSIMQLLVPLKEFRFRDLFSPFHLIFLVLEISCLSLLI